MTEGLPLSRDYNLARLGNAGDEVLFAADADQRAAIARWSGVVSVEKLEARVEIRKISPTRFGLTFHLLADVTQACVVTLEPVAGHMEHSFVRELHFAGTVRHKLAESEPVLELDADPEEGPEEFALSLEPYPRRPGVEFALKTDPEDRPESPFAVLKGLKSGL